MDPMPSPVRGFVDTVSERYAVADIGLAGADIDHGRIARGQGQITDRGYRLIIENRLEGQAAVFRFPHTTRGRPHVDDIGIARHALHIGNPATHIDGADIAPLEMSRRFLSLARTLLPGRYKTGEK